MKEVTGYRLASRSLAWAFAACAIGVSGVCLGLQRGGEPTSLRPQPDRKGKPVSLPRGEVLLLEFLQQFANCSGEPVCLAGDEPPETAVDLPKAFDALDARTVRDLLDKNGFDMNRQTYREREVYWVQRNLTFPDKKGRIIRPSDEEGREEPGAAKSEKNPDEGATERPRAGASSLRLYRSEEGPGARYLVIFETSSRKEAEDVLALLRAKRGSR